jgi:selenocysteine lyase/cysteine desulfurase
VSCETGVRLPVREIAEWAKATGVVSLIDGAQSFGAIPVDVHEIGCDFYTMNGHKWLCGPKGTGFLWGRHDRLIELRIAHVGAGSLQEADVESGRMEPWPSGMRFEYGTRSYSLMAGLAGSLDWFDAVGWDNVHGTVAALADELKHDLECMPGVKLLTPMELDQSSGMGCFTLEGIEGGKLCERLRVEYGTHTRPVLLGLGVRICTAHYTNREDLAALYKALAEISAAN